MNSLFSLRTEVWHPLTVHFPIGLLVIATLIGTATLFLNPERKKSWVKTCTIILLIGTLGAWVSVYTGDLADGIVARKLCDPTQLKEHEIAAFNVAYLFSGASLIHLLLLRPAIKANLKRILFNISILLMVVGMGYLVYTGHLGASLVYEQGAGVNKPTADCAGYQ